MDDQGLKEYVLTRLKLGCKFTISNQVSLEVIKDVAADHMTLALTAWVAAGAEHVEIARYETVPASWWQAVLERWAPAWWLRRYPLHQRWIPVSYRYSRVCPHVDVPDPRAHVAYMVATPTVEEWREALKKQ